jgi:hypothetical protein
MQMTGMQHDPAAHACPCMPICNGPCCQEGVRCRGCACILTGGCRNNGLLSDDCPLRHSRSGLLLRPRAHLADDVSQTAPHPCMGYAQLWHVLGGTKRQSQTCVLGGGELPYSHAITISNCTKPCTGLPCETVHCITVLACVGQWCEMGLESPRSWAFPPCMSCAQKQCCCCCCCCCCY